MLIAFEGIDGSGKSTQAALLRDVLRAQGREVVFSKEPTSGKYGQAIRDSLFTHRMEPQQELEAFVNDRREHVETLVAPALARGAVVIIDRYYYSTVAYQGARGLDPVKVLAMNQAFAPRPDVVFLVDVDPKVSLERISKRAGGRDLFETIEEQTKVRDGFLRLAKSEPNFVLIDGAQTPEAMHRQVLGAFQALKR